jgi:hypothetical protein
MVGLNSTGGGTTMTDGRGCEDGFGCGVGLVAGLGLLDPAPRRPPSVLPNPETVLPSGAPNNGTPPRTVPNPDVNPPTVLPKLC